MEGEGVRSLSGKVCYSCKTAVAALFCRAHSAFFCLGCDSRIHNLTLRHARVWLCDVCEQEPVFVTCKADAAALCATCDRHVHSANPLSHRHERHPVIPFHDSPLCPVRTIVEGITGVEHGDLLPTSPKAGDENIDVLLDDVDRYLDLDLVMGDQKLPHRQNKSASNIVADGVVPVVPGKIGSNNNNNGICLAPSTIEGVPCYYDMDCNGYRPFLVYDFKTQSVSQSVSSSSLEVGVVPDHNTIAEVSTASLPHGSCVDTVPLSKIDREARVVRYREKRKNRKFEKTIRYASRKAYAETRPRIKGRFVKRTEARYLNVGYGVVPSF